MIVLVCVASVGVLVVGTCFQQIEQCSVTSNRYSHCGDCMDFTFIVLLFNRQSTAKILTFSIHWQLKIMPSSLEMNGQATDRVTFYCNGVPLSWAYRYLIWFYPYLGPIVGIVTKISSEKWNTPHMPGVPLLGLTLIETFIVMHRFHSLCANLCIAKIARLKIITWYAML